MKLAVLLLGLVLCTGLEVAFARLRPGVKDFTGALAGGTGRYSPEPDSRGSSKDMLQNPVDLANPGTSLLSSVANAGLDIVGTLVIGFISSLLLSNPWILIIVKVISMLLASIKT